MHLDCVTEPIQSFNLADEVGRSTNVRKFSEAILMDMLHEIYIALCSIHTDTGISSFTGIIQSCKRDLLFGQELDTPILHAQAIENEAIYFAALCPTTVHLM